MSNTSENDLNLDLHFLPAWAQQSPDINRYAHFTGDEGGGERGRFRRDRGDRPPGGGGGGARRGAPGQGPGQGARPQGRTDGPRRDSRGPGAGPGAPARPAGPGGDRGGFRGDRGGGTGRGPDRRDDAPVVPLLDLNVSIQPDDKGVDSLARQIKVSGRAYPLFEIAAMILKKSDRHAVALSIRRRGDGSVAQALFTCALDESLWLSEAEAVKHSLDNFFGTFYEVSRVPMDPPKGVYTFVAQCGMSGVILGPPNHHDYQNQLRRLHAERFPRLPFDAFKARVKIVRDEAVVKKWVEDQSFKSEFTCLNVPEPLQLGSREEVDKHFREVHAPALIRSVESITLSPDAVKKLRNQALLRLVRSTLDNQRRFPLQVATHLSQQFASRGLQFFKVNKTVTHVSVARPHYLDLDTNVLTPGVRKIVDHINTHAGCTRRQLVDAIVPGGLPPEKPATPAAAPTQASTADSAAAPVAEAAPAEKPPLSPELQAFASDLHWLIHQGHVIEFATGVMETAKKPAPRPVKAPSVNAAGKGKEKEVAVEAPAETAAEVITTAVSPSSSVEGSVESPAGESAPPAE